MKTRINLYLPELRPKRQYLSLSHLALAWGCFLGLLVLTGGVAQRLLQQSLHQQQTLQQQISVLDAQTKIINEQLQQRHLDSRLERELTLQQAEILSKQQLKTYLNQIGVLQNEGFSAWLYDLAQVRSPSIALQSFDIENNQLRLQGEAASNDAVPAWLSHFGDYPKLRGRTFSTLQVQRQKSGALQFHLESKESAVSSAAGTSP